MMNYYDEIKNDIIEVLEDEHSREHEYLKENKDLLKDTIFNNLLEYFRENNFVLGIIDGSYYCNSYKARKQCYNFSNDVEEALETLGYEKELEKFKIFDYFVEEGWLNIENMQLKTELMEEMLNEEQQLYIYSDFEIMKDLDFEIIDVITRYYKMNEVLWKVLGVYLNKLKK